MKIAIVKLSAMGDIIHAMIVLQYIKSNFPKCSIDWFVDERFKDILSNHPDIDNLYVLKLKNNVSGLYKQFKYIKTISKIKHYDVILDLQGLIKSALVSRAIGKNTVGFEKDSLREPLATLFYSKKYSIPYEENVIHRNIELVSKALSFNTPDPQVKNPFLFSNTKYDIYPELLIFVGSSWKSKIFPKDKYVQIINALHVNTFIAWGNEKEKEDAAYICERTNATMLPQLTVAQLITLVNQSKLIIGSDSGPTHMAWALNRPGITIFGPTPSYRNTLVTDINKTVDSGKRIDAKNINKTDNCIESISTDTVISKAKGLLYG